MDELELQTVRRRHPRTGVVLVLLALTSLTFSYLATYAIADAMVAAEILSPWQAGDDPRPRWLVISFFCLLSVLLSLAGLARFLSRRQLRQIDAMAE